RVEIAGPVFQRIEVAQARTAPNRSKAKRLGGERRDRPTNLRDIALAVGVEAIAEEDDGGLRAGVDPDRGAGETDLADALTLGEDVAAVLGESLVAIPPARAEPAGYRDRIGHELHRFVLEETVASEFAAVKNHLAILREIVGGAE